MNTLAKGCVAEFVGTFALCLFGCGSVVLTHDSVGDGNLITVALAFGTVLAVFVSGCMYISGAQFNPAVSIGVLILGKQSPKQALAFIVTQLIAAGCAIGMMVFLLGTDEQAKAAMEATNHGASLGVLSLGERANPLAVFGIEFFMTFALMFVVLTAVVDERAHKLGGLAVGIVVAMCIVAFGPWTGASMNPARSFGPALYGHWEMHWVYWAAPIAGAVAASMVYKLAWSEDKGEG